MNLEFVLTDKNRWVVRNKDADAPLAGFVVEQSARKPSAEPSFSVCYEGAPIGGSKPRLKECAGIILKHHKKVCGNNM